MHKYYLNHLQELEAEAIYVIREVVAQFDRPAILFSGGKDSIVVTHLARKAFYPAKIPLPLIHIDTGHNFPETMEFRDNLVKELGVQLIVGSVQESIDKGRAKEETGLNASRNALQTVTLLDTIKYKIDAAIGVPVAMKKKHVLKNVFSRTAMILVSGTRKTSALSCGIFSTAEKTRATLPVFPISNWTEMDVWNYIWKENIPIPSLYFAHEREVVYRDNSWLPVSEFLPLRR